MTVVAHHTNDCCVKTSTVDSAFDIIHRDLIIGLFYNCAEDDLQRSKGIVVNDSAFDKFNRGLQLAINCRAELERVLNDS